MAQSISLKQGMAPHFKGEAPLVPVAVRELATALILLSAGVWCGGLSTVLFFGIILGTTVICEILLRFAGFSAAPKWDRALFQQTILLALFLPSHLPFGLVAFAAVTMVLFYRISGGRAGMVFSSVCLALALVSVLKYELHFVLSALPLIPALIVFGLWILIRFPRTQIEVEKAASVLILAGIMAGLHVLPIGTALLWSVVAGEIIFDSAFLPLRRSLRLNFRFIAVLLTVLFVVVSTPEDAVVFVGLIVGFIAAGMEQRVNAGKNYGKA